MPHGNIFICTYGKLPTQVNQVDLAEMPSKISCGRSYMSARDLNAHINHRHSVNYQKFEDLGIPRLQDDKNSAPKFLNNQIPNSDLLTPIGSYEPFHYAAAFDEDFHPNTQNGSQVNSKLPPQRPPFQPKIQQNPSNINANAQNKYQPHQNYMMMPHFY